MFNKDKTELICCPGGKTGNYIIPDSVTEISDSAFEDCDLLTGITIPDGVAEIGDSSFLGCKSLKSITIPDSVTDIGDDAFRDCDLLTIYCNHGSYTEQYAKEKKIPVNCFNGKNIEIMKSIENIISSLKVLNDRNIKTINTLNLTGERLIHNSFGEGVIESQKDNIIYCNFGGNIKKFIFPDIIYQNFASLKDESIMSLFEDVSKCTYEIESYEKELQELKHKIYSDADN